MPNASSHRRIDPPCSTNELLLMRRSIQQQRREKALSSTFVNSVFNSHTSSYTAITP
ncbi:MAG: hypothetical protein ACI89W_000765 [Gammaproteobacteria bacterium]|jgi:hypothetical protein